MALCYFLLRRFDDSLTAVMIAVCDEGGIVRGAECYQRVFRIVRHSEYAGNRPRGFFDYARTLSVPGRDWPEMLLFHPSSVSLAARERRRGRTAL
jgi:hypothetical protein